MGKKSARRERTALLFGGAILAIVAWKILGGAASKFTNGLSFSFTDLKLKIQGVNLRVKGKLTVNNTNGFGVNVQGFEGKLKFGRKGNDILPITVAGFNMAANSSSTTEFESSVSLFALAANIVSVITTIASGEYKKLWVSGTLRTGIVNIPVETDVSILSE